MDDLVFFYPEGHDAHVEYGHPERPERVEIIRNNLEETGLWEVYPHLEPRLVPRNILEMVHDPAYLAALEKASSLGQRLDMDTYTTTASWGLALKAAGGGVAIANAVWQRESKRGFAMTRPPGHHATRTRGMGFCLLNNVALASEFLLSQAGATRLAIVDLDLHHGNGTQDIFWTRDDVLYISTHQYPHYPGSGSLTEIGSGQGKGATVNFPMPPMSGDRAFSTVMDQVILPVLDRFMPEMILVSYGFDTHWLDPLGQLLLSAAGYGGLVARLVGWADRHCEGRIALFLEGGYDLDAAVVCTQAVLAALLGVEWVDPIGPSPIPEGDTWEDVLKHGQKLWGL
jgi:acetoin utilization deacetylase AcuC-like enzyme